MSDPKYLETPENLETRAYYKKQHLKKGRAGQNDVILAATEIYQTEFGHWFEDEGYDGLWEEADALFRKHSLKVTDPSALVDLIVTDLHGDKGISHGAEPPAIRF
ncbi:hypothetical protein [Taklimakanibacter deserti]|uniref:hypothetical protein n=1 Tax=Taklimakanibacter deserti TaxID=2267839 RepID=UPI000E650779